VLLLNGKNFLEHLTAGGILVAEIGNYLTVTVDRNALGHQVFPDHIHK
jgi:hypothetical protein